MRIVRFVTLALFLWLLKVARTPYANTFTDG